MNLSEVVFLLFFLPAAFLLFHLLPERRRIMGLALCSIAFYLWGGVLSLGCLLFEAAVAHLFGRGIEQSRQKGKNGTLPFILGLFFVLLPFCYFRLLQGSLFPLLQKAVGETVTLSYVAPFALAFLVIKGVSFLCEIKKGSKVPFFADTFCFFALFINTAGPAVCWDEFQGVVAAKAEPDLKNGSYLFASGLAKKLVLAEGLSLLWKGLQQESASTFSSVTVLFFAISYLLSVCVGLSAYSDMVEGLGLLFGLPFRKNTDSPLLSVSVLEFWRRFLPGVRRFFSVYLEQPLRGSAKEGLRPFFAAVITFSLTGLFFGNGLNFLCFGLVFGIAACLEEQSSLSLKLSFPLRRILTLLTTLFAFSFCETGSLKRWLSLLLALFGKNGFASQQDVYLLSSYWLLLIFSVIVGWRLPQKLSYRFYKDHPRAEAVMKPILTVLFLIISVAFLGNISESAYIFLPL